MASANQLPIASFILLVFYSAYGEEEISRLASSSVQFKQDAGANTTLICAEEESVAGCHCNSSWVYSINGHCNCGTIPYGLLRCDPESNVGVVTCNCATYNETDETLEVGGCIYSCGGNNVDNKGFDITIPLPRNLVELTDNQCGSFNRTGTLCGRCEDGLSLLAYSFDMNCVECPNSKSNWWKYLLVAYLPLTLFYLLILCLNVNITSSVFFGFVICCQTIALPAVIRQVIMSGQSNPVFQMTVRVLASFYGVWNLDFFRSFNLGICLGTDTLQTLSLDIAVGVYPILLIVLTYFLIHLHDRNFKLLVFIWKPFRKLRSNLEIRTSVIDAFGTSFLLSNIKFLSVSFDLLLPVQVYQLDSTGNLTTSLRLYYDATIPYFGEQHLPYAVLAIAVLTLFVLLPTLLLILYPFRWFQRVLNTFPFRWYILRTFVESYYGCYKDGTEPNTRDCRWFVSVIFIIRIFAYTIGMYILNNLYFSIMAMLLVLFLILQAQLQPFKENKSYLAIAHFLFIAFLALLHTGATGVEEGIEHASTATAGICSIVSILIVTILPMFLLFFILCRVCYCRSSGVGLIRRLHAWRHGYNPLK